jgi:putative phage abortive infection protein
MASAAETSDTKRLQLEKESASVERQIRTVEVFGAVLVCVGFVVAVFGVCEAHRGILALGDLGSFLQGAVGAPFALAGAAFVYVAFLGQKKQFLLQERQIVDNERQIAANRVEQIFFHLLQKYHDIVTSLDLVRADPKQGVIKIAQGRDCFEVMYKRFTEQVRLAQADDFMLEYRFFFNTYQGDLAGYFAHLHQILLFLEKEAPDDDGRRFAGFLSAELSPFEQLLIFYHSLQPPLRDLKRLLEKYSMLVGMPEALLLHQDDKTLYEARAFTL